MADAVTVGVVLDYPKQYEAHLTCISDGTGETNVIKVDKSAIGVATNGLEAASLAFEAVRWNIQGFTSVVLKWDHTTDDVAYVLCGSGYDEPIGTGLIRDFGNTGGVVDPGSAGGTGDILLTSVGASATATYDITLFLRKVSS